MFIEIDVQEDNTGLATYSGEAADADVAQIVAGTYAKPFLRMDQVFLNITKKPEKEWEEPRKVLVRWGHGERRNYLGHMFTRVDRIIHLTPLKDVALRDGTLPEDE